MYDDSASRERVIQRGTHVEVSLSSNFETDVAGRALRVPDRLGSSLDVLVDLVVVRGGEDAQIGQSLESDGVEGSGVSDSERVSSDRSGRDGVGRLSSDEETISSDDLAKPSQQAISRKTMMKLTASAVKVGPLKTSR